MSVQLKRGASELVELNREIGGIHIQEINDDTPNSYFILYSESDSPNTKYKQFKNIMKIYEEAGYEII